MLIFRFDYYEQTSRLSYVFVLFRIALRHTIPSVMLRQRNKQRICCQQYYSLVWIQMNNFTRHVIYLRLIA